MEDLDKPVVLATVTSLQEADVIRMVLESEGVPVDIVGETATNTFSHVTLALNPQGIRIQVPQSKLQEAQEILASHEPLAEEQPEGEPTENLADTYAKRSYLCAIITLILTLTLPLTIYFFVQALLARRKMVPSHPRRYRWQMWVAFLVGILPYLVLVGILIATADFHRVAAAIHDSPSWGA